MPWHERLTGRYPEHHRRIPEAVSLKHFRSLIHFSVVQDMLQKCPHIFVILRIIVALFRCQSIGENMRKHLITHLFQKLVLRLEMRVKCASSDIHFLRSWPVAAGDWKTTARACFRRARLQRSLPLYLLFHS